MTQDTKFSKQNSFLCDFLPKTKDLSEVAQITCMDTLTVNTVVYFLSRQKIFSTNIWAKADPEGE